MMSKRGLTRDEERRLDVISILVESDQSAEYIEWILHNLPIETLFRYHPWRLLRLMSTSAKFMKAVEKRASLDPRFWYTICQHAFPDCVIMLAVYDKQFAFQVEKKIARVYGTYITGRLVLQYDYDTNDTFDRVKSTLLGRRAIKGFCFRSVDRSFTNVGLLDECMVNRETARRVEKCFKMLYPCGIPPAQYCFLSQVVLRELTLAYLAFFVNEDGGRIRRAADTDNSVSSLLQRYCLVGDSYNTPREKWFLPIIPLNECERFLALNPGVDEPIRTITTAEAGPFHPYDSVVGDLNETQEYRDFGDVYWGEIFTLAALQDTMAEFARENWEAIENEDSRKKYVTLYERVILARLVYMETDEALDGFVYYDCMAAKQVVGVSQEMRDRVLEAKRVNREKYADEVDPLYWEVVFEESSAFEHFTNEEWKTVIVAQIDIVKKFYRRDSPEYTRIESATITAPLACLVCGDTANLMVELSHPLNTFCSAQCQIVKHSGAK